MQWLCRDRVIDCSTPRILGIVNVTPDSFSDGGRFFDPQAAVDHGLRLIADGADILDIGGESTRPKATPVPQSEELRRVMPVVEALARHAPISIDTMKPEVARQAIAVGACIINDVSGFRDFDMVHLASVSGVGVIVNHMHGTPQTMQDDPRYSDVVAEIDGFFEERIATLTAAGVRLDAISLDPGIGFGKRLEHTIRQLRELRVHQRHNRPICLGVSRKGFLGQITGRPREERLAATLAVNCLALASSSAQILRVHDVAPHRDALAIYRAVQPSRPVSVS